MKNDQAHAMLSAARDHAAGIGTPVSIAIVDAHGALLMLERLDGAPPVTAFLAEGKAVASAVLGLDSAVLEELGETLRPVVDALVTRHAGRFVAAQGAVVVRSGSEIVGAVGVSGALSAQDEAIARAAADAHPR